MSTKELSKDLRDKVVERHRSGDAYKNITKALNIPWSRVKTIIKKCKVYGTTKTMPRLGHPSKVDDQVRRRLNREATNRPMATLKELHTGLYGKDWSQCACDNNIPSTPQIWYVQ